MIQRRSTCYAFALVFLATACNSDRTENNPSFNAGSGGASSRPRDAGADVSTTSSGGVPNDASIGAVGTGGLDASPSAGGTRADSGSTGGATGAGGTGADAAPPYDCVLHPKTHVEIINACTDAVRIEKHPMLPPIPMQ